VPSRRRPAVEARGHGALESATLEKELRNQPNEPRDLEIGAVDRGIHGAGKMFQNLGIRPIAEGPDFAGGKSLGIAQQIVVAVVANFASSGHFGCVDCHYRTLETMTGPRAYLARTEFAVHRFHRISLRLPESSPTH